MIAICFMGKKRKLRLRVFGGFYKIKLQIGQSHEICTQNFSEIQPGRRRHMSETYAIRYADLGKIEQNLGRIREDLSAVHGNLSIVSENVKRGLCKNRISLLRVSGFCPSAKQEKQPANCPHRADSRPPGVGEKKYGHYDIVRRTTAGILQATDLSIVKKQR